MSQYYFSRAATRKKKKKEVKYLLCCHLKGNKPKIIWYSYRKGAGIKFLLQQHVLKIFSHIGENLQHL